MNLETAEVIATKAAKAGFFSAGGTIATVYAWATSNEGLGLLGLCVSVIGLLVMWHYKREADKRAAIESAQRQAERELRMSLMRASGRPVYHQDTDMGKLEAMSE